MKTVKNIFAIAFYNIKKWRSNYRIWFVMLYVAYFTSYYTENLPNACYETGLSASPWLFPFMLTSRNIVLYFVLPLVIIFCDAPFLDNSQPYIIVRSRRSTWAVGQIVYIVMASFIYTLYMVALSILINIRVMNFTSGWGDLIKSSSANTALSHWPRGYFFIDEYILKYFTPFQAMWFSFLLFWFAGILIGLLIFCLNSVTSTRIAGTVSAAFLIVFAFVVFSELDYIKYAPITWVSLANIDVGNQSPYLPSFTYVMTVYISLFAVLIAAIMIHNRRRSIEVLPPV